MDRTIHFGFFGPCAVFPRCVEAIEAYAEAERQLQLSRSMSFVGRTAPSPFPGPAARYDVDERVLFGRGGFDIGDNEWHALVVARYLAWVTQYAPGLLVKAHDDGRYFLADDLLFHNGIAMLDPDRTRAELGGGRGNVTQAARSSALTGVAFHSRPLFATVPAAPYAHEPAIRALGLSGTQLSQMTLDVVAARVVFPWDMLDADAA